MNQFDQDYFERGVQARVSGYTNYHWRPEYVLPAANTIKNLFQPSSALDYGCAKGYLVKALRLLGVNAWGYDISTYAIENADEDAKPYVSNTEIRCCELVIAKDVLEHVPESKMAGTLQALRNCTYLHAFVVVPLGDSGFYRIREYELDATHQIREDEVWWMKRFDQAGFTVSNFHYAMTGIKDHWTSRYPNGNGIFTLKVK